MVPLDASENRYASHVFYKPMSQKQEILEGHEVQKTYQNKHSLIWKVRQIALALFLIIISLRSFMLERFKKFCSDTVDNIKTHVVYSKTQIPNKRVDGNVFENTRHIEELTANVARLKFQIYKIDSFIAAREDLKNLCLKYLEKDRDNIAFYTKPDIDHLDPNNKIDAWTLLKLKVIQLEHSLTERMSFIERNPEVYDTFKKYIEEIGNSKMIDLASANKTHEEEH